MTFVISLEGYTPSPRYDGHPWTEAQIGYAPASAGPFTTFDTITLSPVDTDPTQPLERNLTSTLSPSPSGWFLVTFLDAAGNQEPTRPVAVAPLEIVPSRGRMLAETQSQIINPGGTGVSSVSAPPQLTLQLTWRLISDTDGTIVIAESSDSIVEIDDGHDAGLRRYDRSFTAPDTAGRYLAIWRLFSTEEVAQTIVVATSAETMFASPVDVASRLGRSLTSAEAENVPFMLTMATAVITDAAGFDDGWAAALRPVPQLLRMMSVELVCRAMKNPSHYASIRQQAGSYSFEATQSIVGMALSDNEVMMIRRAVHGRTTDTAVIDSSFKPAQDEYWLRKQSVRFSDPQDSVIP